jgi:DNA-binding response OmpR family regulator
MLPLWQRLVGHRPCTRGRVVAKQILVVEDDAYLRDLQLLVLSGAGYAATALETATEALHRLGEIRPHLIVLDVSLPGMDGRDFLKRLRASALWRHVPVIVSSGLPAAEIGPLRSGETELLGKPFSDAALLARVRSLIGEA